MGWILCWVVGIIDFPFLMIEQKGIVFDHEFGYSFLQLFSLLIKDEEEKENK